MTSQPGYFSSRSRRIGNPNHSTPWGRYRHGCDPPACRGRSKSRGPTCTSVQSSRRFVHHIAFPAFQHFSPSQSIYRNYPPQSSLPFREVFPSGQAHHHICSLSCATGSPTLHIHPKKVAFPGNTQPAKERTMTCN